MRLDSFYLLLLPITESSLGDGSPILCDGRSCKFGVLVAILPKGIEGAILLGTFTFRCCGSTEGLLRGMAC